MFAKFNNVCKKLNYFKIFFFIDFIFCFFMFPFYLLLSSFFAHAAFGFLIGGQQNSISSEGLR